mmetsp:Transcript_22330/g.62272  ORF Transcript_22330/g.62272 Transcript_22330/m.62272 type:complete len:85 (-) Transcript_22330:84-338(-)
MMRHRMRRAPVDDWCLRLLSNALDMTGMRQSHHFHHQYSYDETTHASLDSILPVLVIAFQCLQHEWQNINHITSTISPMSQQMS